MLKRLVIKNFKRFGELTISDLDRLNIIVGINNVGKTTLLEAIMGFASGMNLSSTLNFTVWHRAGLPQGMSAYQLTEAITNSFNSIGEAGRLTFSFGGIADGEKKEFIHQVKPGQIISTFLHESHTVIDGTEVVHRQVPMPLPMAPGGSLMIDVPVRYLGTWEVLSDGEDKVTCELSAPLQFSHFSNRRFYISAMIHDFTIYLNESQISQTYSRLHSADKLGLFVKEMNKSFSGITIKSIDNVPYPDGNAAPISVRLENGRRLPLYALGDGIRRWYELLGGMITFPSSIHCIEEADATFHHEAQDGFATRLAGYSEEYNNQVFMTTHSIEYLKTFLNAIEKEDAICLKNRMRVITLRDYGDDVRHRTLDGTEALTAIRRGLELRL